MIDYIVIGIIIIIASLFIFSSLLAIYLLILLIYSRGFKISPTVTSSSKSIRFIAGYIKKYVSKVENKEIRILDIGSGYGTLLFRLNTALKNITNKQIKLVGYEISSFAYKISKIRNNYNNIEIIKDDINNLNDFNFDIVITFILAKQQKLFLNIYRKFPKNTIIIANSLAIPFEKDDNFQLIETIKVCFRWNIFIYKKTI